MIYPLSWLEDYTKLPKSLDELTDKLTMIGHMLDKKAKVGSEDIIDLELRGNRPDLLGVYGMAREISAAFATKLGPLKLTPLPKTDPKSELIVVKDPDLLERFQALTLTVKVKSSPDWLKRRLACFGIPSINNVVDITNYVMLETGEPMHAFDFNKLTGHKLILRRAHQNEQIVTIQGSTQTLKSDDLVLADLKKPQGITMVGSRDSGTTSSTTEILLEAAVYKYGNVRKTGRRLGIHTEAGTRHEKILDPNNVQVALERALTLLIELADAKPTSSTFDFYPEKRKPLTIPISESEVTRLTSLVVDAKDIKSILESLGAKVEITQHDLKVEAPTFRTDIDQTADLVEEVARIVGYEKISPKSLSTFLPNQVLFPQIAIEDQLKDKLVSFGFKETINLSLIPNKDLITFGIGGKFPKEITLLNPPDPTIGTLRPSLIPGLIRTALKAHNFKQANLAFFETGKVFFENTKGLRFEQNNLSLVKPLKKLADQLLYSEHLGIVTNLLSDFGVDPKLIKTDNVASFNPDRVAEIQDQAKKVIGYVGLLHPQIANALKLGDIFMCELNIERLTLESKRTTSSHFLYAQYPSLTEDMTFDVQKDTNLGDFLAQIYTLSPLITDVKLVSIFNRARTIRISYQDPTKSVSGIDVKPLRDKILALGEKTYKISLKD